MTCGIFWSFDGAVVAQRWATVGEVFRDVATTTSSVRQSTKSDGKISRKESAVSAMVGRCPKKLAMEVVRDRRVCVGRYGFRRAGAK